MSDIQHTTVADVDSAPVAPVRRGRPPKNALTVAEQAEVDRAVREPVYLNDASRDRGRVDGRSMINELEDVIGRHLGTTRSGGSRPREEQAQMLGMLLRWMAGNYKVSSDRVAITETLKARRSALVRILLSVDGAGTSELAEHLGISEHRLSQVRTGAKGAVKG